MRKHGRHKPHHQRHHGGNSRVTEREMSSYTFRSSTPIDDTLNMVEITQSETDLTWRYKSPWNDLLLNDLDDDGLSIQLDNILNPDSDSHHEEKNILFILEKLNKYERNGDDIYLSHCLDELLYVITTDLLNSSKSKKPEKAIKKFKKHFSSSSDISTWFVDHEYSSIYDSDNFHLINEYIGHENENKFWLTIKKLIIKYFQIDIELQKSPIINWPSSSLWTQTFKQSLLKKIKEISPDKTVNINLINNSPKNNAFDEANLHHSKNSNKTAEIWYKEFLCHKDSKMNSTSRIKQKQMFIKQHRICDGCGHTIKLKNYPQDTKNAIIYEGGWPKQEKFVFHDQNCLV